jgi:hypothetical protein
MLSDKTAQKNAELKTALNGKNLFNIKHLHQIQACKGGVCFFCRKSLIYLIFYSKTAVFVLKVVQAKSHP